MERKEQTGHICRWMACGIMAAINLHLQKMIAAVDKNVNKGIAESEQQIEELETHYTYYCIGMLPCC